MLSRSSTLWRLWSTDAPFSTWWPWYTTPTQRQSLLRLVAVATEEKLPLGPLVETWAADERGVQKRRLRRLASLLNAGTPLPDAVEEVPRVLRDEDVLAIRFGAQSGMLAAAIRDAIDDAKPAPLSRVPRFRKAIVYGCIVLLVALPIVAFLQLEIMPSFVMILRECSSSPPAVVEWSLGLTQAVTDFWWLGALAVIALLLTLFSAWPGRFVRHAVLGRLFGPLRELRSAEYCRN